MIETPNTTERDIPPPCLNCRSLHKQYTTILCEQKQDSYFRLERLRSIPILGRFVREWGCSFRKCETVEDLEQETEP